MNAAEDFFRRLKAVNTAAEAEQLVHDGHRYREAGQLHYSNLAWFLDNFRAPPGAGLDELQSYTELIARLMAEGFLDEDRLRSAERELLRAIQEMTH